MQTYQPRFQGQQLPAQIQDRTQRPEDERNARLLRLIGAAAPAVGAGIGAIGGGLIGGPGGALAGIGAGATTGAGIGQAFGGLANFGAQEAMRPNTMRDLERDERLKGIIAMLSARK